jgi:hypothetical protein
MTAYPTSPPWAPPPAPPAVSQPAPPPHTMHGQLLVPYPEEMQNADRPRPPAVWPVVVCTLLFGVFGAISASRRMRRARRMRISTARYWIAFLVTLVAAGFLSFVVATVAALPIIDNVRETVAVDAVQQNLVRDGRLQKTAGMTATAATCTAVDMRRSDGKRDYNCLLTLSDGRTGTIGVTADRAGDWTPARS